MQNRMPLPPLTIHSIFSPSQPRLLNLCLLSPAICASEIQFKFDGNVLELDDSNFDAAISKFDYIFVDFYVPWCGHCTHLAPEVRFIFQLICLFFDLFFSKNRIFFPRTSNYQLMCLWLVDLSITN